MGLMKGDKKVKGGIVPFYKFLESCYPIVLVNLTAVKLHRKALKERRERERERGFFRVKVFFTCRHQLKHNLVYTKDRAFSTVAPQL